MHCKHRIERIKSGNYLVHVQEGLGACIGSVTGADRTWCGIFLGEGQNLTRKCRTLKQAVRELLLMLYANPIEGIPRPRPRFATWFALYPYHDEWVQEFGDKALEEFARTGLEEWLEAIYPTHTQFPISDLEELQDLASTMHRFAGMTERDIVRFLAHGEQSERWRLPVVEGILTPGYWRAVFASEEEAA